MDNKNCEFILDTNNLEKPNWEALDNNPYKIRRESHRSNNEDEVLVSVYIQAYNRLEKTKKCLTAILENTKDINYELILVDNGSDDMKTLEYFKSIEHKKKIVRVTKNIGSGYPVGMTVNMCDGKYIVIVSNDVYVTYNWLQNLLNCMESDETIGMVGPMSTNISNLQQPDNYVYTSYEKFQKDAKKFNEHSVPSKWQERLRLITVLAMYRKEVLKLVGYMDSAFLHDFGEDDLCARIRRAGYKMMLAGDTFVHHDHNISIGEDKNMEEFKKILAQGREAFQEKYYGLDAWNDILNFELTLFSNIYKAHSQSPSILGIDIKCGQPILSLANKLREQCIYNTQRYAFTTEAKYFSDLQYVCHGDNVKCDRIEYILEYYAQGSMDYIVLGEPINTYHNPGKLLIKLLTILKEGGVLCFKLRNITGVKTQLNLIGQISVVDDDIPTLITVEEMINTLQALNIYEFQLKAEPYAFDHESINNIQHLANQLNQGEDYEKIFNKLITKDYCFCIRT
ncbi:glycosyltransferase family 2 protein [Aminipila sp.]|uniref:glycosyltransferase family 2 protein n=1 Tax=Aminipila sp. TaxID=2060095 RepID=UPI002896C6E8|nr:glycosyltransferase [Aminipila sp.]